MNAPVALIGELALHCFVPSDERGASVAPEATVQLGGGAGIAARHLHGRGTPFAALTFSGGDEVGRFLHASLESLSSSRLHTFDRDATSSVVYLLHDRALQSLRVVPGSARADVVLSQLERLPKDAIVYCPYFAGYERVARALSELPVRAIFDFGHFANVGDLERTLALLRSSPTGWIAQFSAEPIGIGERARLLDAARAHGCLHAFVTAGDGPVLGFDDEGSFAIAPKAVSPVCSIGAGDVFMAELAAQLSEGASFRGALAGAVRAATAKCLCWGLPKTRTETR